MAGAWLLATLGAYHWRRKIPWPELYRDLVVIAGLGALTLAFFWQLVFLPNAYVPRGGGDLLNFLYPVYSLLSENLQDGRIPFWDPHLYSGSPFMADMQSGVFYPPNVIVLYLARPFTYGTMEMLAALHYFLAGAFMYVYLRGLRLARVPSLGGGVVFAFGGFMVAHLGHLNMLAAASWLPLVLFFWHRAVTRPSLPAAAGAGAVYGVSILAGHTQTSLLMGFLLLLYWGWALAAACRQKGHERRRLAPVAGALPVLLLVAVGGTLFQLYPSWELSRHSIRAGLSYRDSVTYSSSPLGLITLVVPHFFGRNFVQYWGVRWSLVEVYGYVGLLTLLLAALALVVRRRGSLLSWPWFFGGVAVLSLLISLGEDTVVHGWLYRFLPGFDKVRAPGRFLYLFDLSAAVLAAFGLQALTGRLARRDRPAFRSLMAGSSLALAGGILVALPFFYHAMLTSQDKAPTIFKRTQQALDSLGLSLIFLGLALGLLLLWRYRPRMGTAMPALAVALLSVDLFSANIIFNPDEGKYAAGFEHTAAVQYLREQGAGARLDSVTGADNVWEPSLSLLERLDDVMGAYNPMQLADYDRFWKNLPSRSVPAYDLAGSYVIGHKDVRLDWNKFRLAFDGDPQVNVYKNTHALPRALLVPAAEQVSHKGALERLRSDTFDPTAVVLLEREPPLPANAEPLTYEIGDYQRTSPNELRLHVSTNRPAYLLLADAYYPGWRAEVDGKSAPVLRADYTYQVVPVPAGEYDVRLEYRPRHWTSLLVVSALVWLGVLAMAGVMLWRRFAASRAGGRGSAGSPPAKGG